MKKQKPYKASSFSTEKVNSDTLSYFRISDNKLEKHSNKIEKVLSFQLSVIQRGEN